MKLVLAVLALYIGFCTGVSLRGDVSAKGSRDDFVHVLVKRNENNSSWISRHIVPVAVGGGVGLLVIMVVVIIIFLILCVCLINRRKPARSLKGVRKPLLQNGSSAPQYGDRSQPQREPSVVEAMNRERREKEIQEKKKAMDSVQYFLRNNTQYALESELSDLGSRMQKHWFKVTSSEGEGKLLLTTTPVSQKCPLKLDAATLKGMNKLVKELRKHPFLQPIIIIDYLAARQQLVIVQPFREGGSLKDTIYRATPSTDWSNKYSRRSKGLTIDKIKLYGRQILEAMLFLYSRGFPQLGHVQSGNVFIVNDTCLLGGYENTLLGYKTRLFKMCKEHLERLDVIMFGHLLFEMCCGYELTSVIPTEQDYKCAKKEEVKEILQFVFEEDQIEHIRQHKFFSMTLKQLDNFDPSSVKMSGSITQVLEKVCKGKPRQQKASKPKDDAPPQAPPTAQAVTPPPTREIDDATPVNTVDSPKKGAESEPGVGMDSAGDKSSDSNKEGKRKGRRRFGFGGKKKKESTPTADSGTDPDKTPIQPTLEEQA